jgi:hypothetical protein
MILAFSLSISHCWGELVLAETNHQKDLRASANQVFEKRRETLLSSSRNSARGAGRPSDYSILNTA